MIKVHVDNVFAKITYDDVVEREWVNSVLSFPADGYESNTDYLNGKWDGFHRYLRSDDTFYSGLYEEVLFKADESGIKIDITWADSTPRGYEIDFDKEVARNSLRGKELRDYQLQAIETLLKANRGVIRIPTGGGKTVTIGGAIKHLDATTLYICNSSAALGRLYDEFIKMGFQSVGRLGGGYRETDKQITLAIVNSLASGIKRSKPDILNLLQRIVVLIFDETHHVPASTWTLIGENCPAPFRYGLSGTPFRNKGIVNTEPGDWVLIGLTGVKIVDITSGFLRQGGYLAEPIITMVPNLRKVFIPPKLDMVWHAIYKRGIVNNLHRNAIGTAIAAQLYHQAFKVLLIVKEIEHGKNILGALWQFGIPAEFRFGGDQIFRPRSDGEMIPESESIIKTTERFGATDRAVLIGSPIMDEDVDLPSINGVVLLSGGKSPISTIQRIGRGLRRKSSEDGNFVLVFDFNDHSPYQLQNHSKARINMYKEEDFKIHMDLEAVNQILKSPLVLPI